MCMLSDFASSTLNVIGLRRQSGHMCRTMHVLCLMQPQPAGLACTSRSMQLQSSMQL